MKAEDLVRGVEYCVDSWWEARARFDGRKPDPTLQAGERRRSVLAFTLVADSMGKKAGDTIHVRSARKVQGTWADFEARTRRMAADRQAEADLVDQVRRVVPGARMVRVMGDGWVALEIHPDAARQLVADLVAA